MGLTIAILVITSISMILIGWLICLQLTQFRPKLKIRIVPKIIQRETKRIFSFIIRVSNHTYQDVFLASFELVRSDGETIPMKSPSDLGNNMIRGNSSERYDVTQIEFLESLMNQNLHHVLVIDAVGHKYRGKIPKILREYYQTSRFPL